MAGQGRGGNEGMSGTAMWKVKQQFAQQIAAMPVNQELIIEDTEPPKAPNILVDAVTMGGSNKLVRHVLIKNFEKAARALKFKLPTEGIFGDKAPVGLSALFDGQSCAGEPGPFAADFCARQFHIKLLETLSSLQPPMCTENFVKAVLIKCFEDLDSDLLASNPDLKDGCGAVVSLTIGDNLFVVQLGQCAAVLCEMVGGQPRPVPLGGGHSSFATPQERVRLQQAGALVMGTDEHARIRLPNGTMSAVSRSLGDRMWKGAAVGGVGNPILTCEPTVTSTKIQGPGSHPYVFLCSSSVSIAMTPQDMVGNSLDFQCQPRAASGLMATLALQAHTESSPQCTVVQACFLPKPEVEAQKKKEEPAAKKAKLGATIGVATKSMRLRHILVKYVDPAAKHAMPGRSKDEAEAVLREAIKELRKDAKDWRIKPKGVNDIISMSTPKFTSLCRKLSECTTAKQGGAMCGDLGWISPEQRKNMGLSFLEVTEAVQPGSWSDIAISGEGMHIVQRLA